MGLLVPLMQKLKTVMCICTSEKEPLFGMEYPWFLWIEEIMELSPLWGVISKHWITKDSSLKHLKSFMWIIVMCIM